MNEVTQADRGRAWPFRPEGYGPDSKSDWDSGVYDGNPIIQAFRDHRLAATKAMQEECAKLVESGPDDHISYPRLWRIATAIRAISPGETL